MYLEILSIEGLEGLQGAMNSVEKFVDVKVAAAYLGISTRQLNHLARTGKVPAHSLPMGGTGKRTYWRFKISELNTMMESGK